MLRHRAGENARADGVAEVGRESRRESGLHGRGWQAEGVLVALVGTHQGCAEQRCGGCDHHRVRWAGVCEIGA